MLESEQAQAIAEIKRRHADAYIKPTGEPCEYDGHIAFEQVTALLEIVDSQAQKVAELQAKLAGTELALGVEIKETEKQGREIIFLNNLITEATISLVEKKDTIAEQAKEIESLKSILEVVAPTMLRSINSGMDIQTVDIGPQLRNRTYIEEKP